MMRVLPLVLLCAVVHAAELRIPSVPPSVHFDTESVTNAPILPPMMERARIFRASIALWATPSNNVELAFGASRLDTDAGILILR